MRGFASHRRPGFLGGDGNATGMGRLSPSLPKPCQSWAGYCKPVPGGVHNHETTDAVQAVFSGIHSAVQGHPVGWPASKLVEYQHLPEIACMGAHCDHLQGERQAALYHPRTFFRLPASSDCIHTCQGACTMFTFPSCLGCVQTDASSQLEQAFALSGMPQHVVALSFAQAPSSLGP